MSLQSPSWESRLLNWAQEGLHDQPVLDSLPLAGEEWFDLRRLPEAYAQCEQVTRQHSHTFHLASQLLPPEKRRAARALYAFCRISDDLVDRSRGNSLSDLRDWQRRTLEACCEPDDFVAAAWWDTRRRFNIPQCYAEQLLAGVERDLHQARYQTFDDLTTYCYSVAATVGLMTMHIVGFAGTQAVPYAVRLGVALQLTNILRDVGEDWREGRLYLPLDELREYGLDEGDIERGVVDERWRRFMSFQIQRNRDLYASSLPGIQILHPDGRFAIAAAALLYQAILQDIERHDYDVFNRRAYVSAWGKLRRLPGIWRLSVSTKHNGG